jgi:Root hair defective 3 GTP-binding protein (RHD3)
MRSYEQEASYFDAAVRAEHGDDLRAKLAAAAAGPFSAQATLLSARQFEHFERSFAAARADARVGFSDAADAAAAEALAGFDSAAGELLVPGTTLTGEGAGVSAAQPGVACVARVVSGLRL